MTVEDRSASSDADLELNPGTKSWVPRGHPISWWTLVVTTGAILMTPIAGVHQCMKGAA